MRTNVTVALLVAMGAVACSTPDRSSTLQPPPQVMLSPDDGSDRSTPYDPAMPTMRVPPTLPPLPPLAPEAKPATEAVVLSDGQILQIVHVVHAAEIEQANVALKMARDPRTKALAGVMLANHTDADARAVDLAQREQLPMTPSSLSTSLETGEMQTLSFLVARPNATFDRAYLDAQLNQRRALMDLIDKVLLPNATTPSVRDYVLLLRQTAEAELKEARWLQDRTVLR